MPFFVYKIYSLNNIEHLDTFDKYRDAKTYVRDLRATAPAEADYTVRMMHASNNIEAEKLLTTPRDERVVGEE